MFRVLFLLLVSFCVPVHADVKLVDIITVDQGGQPIAKPRATWDNTGKFCYAEADRVKPDTYGPARCGSFTEMGEIKLRDLGQWTSSPYVAALSDDSKTVAGQYSMMYVRYLAVEDEQSSKIIVHIFFTQNKDNKNGKTLFALGEAMKQPGGRVKVVIDRVAHSEPIAILMDMLFAASKGQNLPEGVPSVQIYDWLNSPAVNAGQQYESLVHIAEDVVAAYLK